MKKEEKKVAKLELEIIELEERLSPQIFGVADPICDYKDPSGIYSATGAEC